LDQDSRFRTEEVLSKPGSVAAVSDRRLSLPAISAVGDRRYRVLQEHRKLFAIFPEPFAGKNSGFAGASFYYASRILS
jgi:hypothetical protein